MLVIAGSAKTHATSPGARARSSASRSVNSTARVVWAGSTGGPTFPSRERVLPWPSATGDLAREPERSPVGVGGRQREQPARHPEAAAQLLPYPRRVLGRKHHRQARSEALLQDGDHLRRAVTGHRPGVAEAEVDVLVTVDV